MTELDIFLQTLLQALTLIFMLVGLFGLVIPVFPGLIIIWLASLAFALIQASLGNMAWIDWTLFALMTLLMLGGSVVDNIIIAYKMRDKQIPWKSIGLSYLAGILGSIFLTPLVGLVAAPLGLVGAEYLRFRNWRQAFDSAKTYMLAWGWSFAALFGIGTLMIILWMLWAWL
jgi:uncharacterized protein YqgC (DUF456 family)